MSLPKSEGKVVDAPTTGMTPSNRTYYFNDENNITELELEKDFTYPDSFKKKAFNAQYPWSFDTGKNKQHLVLRKVVLKTYGGDSQGEESIELLAQAEVPSTTGDLPSAKRHTFEDGTYPSQK